MTKALPFTENSIRRAIRGVEKAGLYVIGVRPDGTLIVGSEPIDSASILPTDLHSAETVPPSKWETFRA